MSTAQQLINARKYNDAILILTKVMRDKPQDFERVQAMLTQINKARTTYNDKVAQLIKVFNEGDLVTAYKIIQQLEALDKAPNARTLESQAYARQTATFVYDSKQLATIMDKAAPLIKSGDYAGAIKLYLSGFDIGLNLFNQANYGNIITDKVMGLRDSIRTSATAYIDSLSQLDSERQTIEQDIARPVALTNDLPSFVTSLRKIKELTVKIQRDIIDLKIQQQTVILQRSGDQNVPLIGFLDQLVHGRSTAKEPEGILATMNTSWTNVLEGVYAQVAKHATERFAAARQDYSAQKWQNAQSVFTTAKSYAVLAEQAASVWGKEVVVGTSLAIPDAGWTAINRRLPDLLNSQMVAQAAEGYTALVDQLIQAGKLIAGATPSSNSVDVLATDEKTIGEFSQKVRTVRSNYTALKSHYSALSTSQLDLSPGMQRIDEVIAAADAALNEGNQIAVAIVARVGNLRLQPVAQGLTDAKGTVAKATSLLDGIPPKNATGAAAQEIKEKYPDQAEQLLTGVQSDLQKYAKSVDSTHGYLTSTDPAIEQAQPVQKLIAYGQQLGGEIRALDSTVGSSISLAKKSLFEAQRYLQQGHGQYSRAQNDVAQRQYARARQEIAAAAASFDKSLSYQESASVRQLRDHQLPQLSAQITNAENAVVVQDVRTYINQGRNYYSQGDYVRAQDLFLKAQSRWSMTNTKPNPEIDTWLKYVNTALSINSGRIVSPTDPLYPEITQVLNLAQQDYQDGRSLIAKGDTSKADQVLAEARTKLIYVQVPFPLNKDARVLSLKILQLTDPKNFAATFRQKFDQAVGELKTNPASAYVALKDLQAIEPNYQGLSNELYRAEILTGIRRPPPNTAHIAESKSLYEKAFNIVRQNVRAQFPIALSYLNQAIELDPNNQAAASLKDRISIDQGAATTVVLSSTAQAQFKLAQEQFIAKSYYEALRIVNQLLQNPENQNYSPLLQLKRRIESKI